MARTSVMSAGLRVFRAEIAASSAGMASAKSFSHSSLMAWAAAAASLATASSAATTCAQVLQVSMINFYRHFTCQSMGFVTNHLISCRHLCTGVQQVSMINYYRCFTCQSNSTNGPRPQASPKVKSTVRRNVRAVISLTNHSKSHQL